jgi:hypothetical protein
MAPPLLFIKGMRQGLHLRILGLLFPLVLSGPAHAVQSPISTAPKSAVACGDLLRRPERQTLREAFIRQFASQIYATEEENQKWIDESLAPGASHGFYVVMENAWLKRLNDQVIKDKDLVTALTNYHKELFLKNLKPALGSMPHDIYSDFKSVRLKVQAPLSDSLKIRLQEMFEITNEEFFTQPLLKNILRAQDLRPEWFTMGVAASADEASSLAEDGGHMFWDASFENLLENKRQEIQDLEKHLRESFKNTPLLDPSTSSFTLEVFTHGRKAPSPEKLKELLDFEFPEHPIALPEIESLYRYLRLVDDFSPPLLIAKREILSLQEAPYGAISLDFIGLGAENLRGTARALSGARHLHEVFQRAREEEREVTRLFQQRKLWVRETVESYFQGAVNLRFSGDDGVIVPRRPFEMRDQLLLVQRLSRLMPRPYFRMSFINAQGASSAYSSQLITHAEGIEKILRLLLQRSLGREAIQKIHIGVFNPDVSDQRTVFLVLGLDLPLSQEQKHHIRADFHKAVKMVEEDLRAKGGEIQYEDGEVFAVPLFRNKKIFPGAA